MTFHVDSEVGRLRQVIVHRPGLELARLTPDNVDELLFDDVMWAERAGQEHDGFVRRLTERGVLVHHFADLLTDALDQPGAREFLYERLTAAARFGPALDLPVHRLVATTPAHQLADLLIGGVLKRDVVSLLHTSSLLMDALADDDFLLRPLPNHLFQRDNVAWIYGGLSINPMAKPARRRETINSRLVYNFHPMFRDAGLRFYYGNDDTAHEPATIEGGDVHVIGNGAVMVGMGERTAPQGIETLSRALFRSGQATRVIAVELPKARAFMHLDTAMTMVDRDAFSVYPYLPDALRSFTLTPVGTGTHTLAGVEAVIDKDRASAVLARDLHADLLVIATDVDAVFTGRGTPDQKAIATAHPDALAALDFPAGSMGPKVDAAAGFASSTGNDAVIGALTDLPALLDGDAGTRVSTSVTGITYRD